MSPKTERLILVLEDFDDDLETVLESLKNAGFRHEVRQAATGDDFLERLRGNGGSPLRPCIILLDLNTPGLDGCHALREIKTDARLKILPVVIFAASSNTRDLEYSYPYWLSAVSLSKNQELLA